jgi:predicted ATP-grasp superfamily ATP-dependent carboligase
MKILFTEGSSVSARQALYCLGPRHTIDILDPAPFCQCRFSRFVRKWYRCPSFSREPETYLSFLIERLRAERYDVLLPTHEQVFLLARFRDELRRYTALALPPAAVLDQMLSKACFVRVLAELGLPCPPTEIVRDRAGLLRTAKFPGFVKLAYSTAGEGVRLVRDAAELTRVAAEFDRRGWLDGSAEILVQRPATGNKRAVTAVLQHGRLVASHCVQSCAIGVGGSGMAEVSVAHPEAIAPLERIGAHFQWHGAICLEYFHDPASGRIELIECNPRVAQSSNAWLSGVNLCEQLVEVSLDRQVSPLSPGRVGVHSHQGFLVLMAKALEGTGRPALLGEIARWWRGRGLYQDSQDELTRPREDWLSIVPAAAVALLLVARPGAAKGLVTRTVNNYSLHQTAVEAMRRVKIL